MEEVYSAITTWAGNVNNVYQRNHDTIRDCYQRVCVFYQEVVDTIRVDGTIEPENNTRLFTAMEEVAQLFLGDLYGQIIQFADDADQQQRALTRLLDVQARSAATSQVLRHQLSHSKQSTSQSQPTSPTQQTSSQSRQTPNRN
ncbi:hypothetical protein E4U19_001715, partial [Claviceps sp. Clav32 group G5]